MSPDTRERDLERFFKDHGFSKSIVEFVVKQGYGFVIFDDRRDADDAVYELHDKELLGSRLQIEFAKQQAQPGDRDFRGRSPPRGSGGGGGFSSKYGRPYNTEYRVLVQNLSTRCSWQDLKDYFRQSGEVTFAKCNREKMGEGVVEFASSSDMKNAIRKLDDTELFGKRLRCQAIGARGSSRSRSPAGRGGGGGGGGGGRSRSRSRSRSPAGRGGGGGRSRSRSRSRSP